MLKSELKFVNKKREVLLTVSRICSPFDWRSRAVRATDNYADRYGKYQNAFDHLVCEGEKPKLILEALDYVAGSAQFGR